MTDDETTRPRLRRSSTLRAYDVEDRLVLVDPGGDGCELRGDSADLGRFVLSWMHEPRTADDVLAELGRLSGEPVAHPEVVHDLLGVLRSVGAIEPYEAAARRPGPRGHRPRRIALGVTGAVATMTTPALVQALQRRGFDVRVMMTDNARRFVTEEALQALTHHRPVSSLWPVDEASSVPHIDLARWADAVVICPASATTISRLATADHDCVVAAAALATQAPVLVVPSMNPAMYESPGVQRNLEQLAHDGFHVAHPGPGLEMADAPPDRLPQVGAAPPPAVIVPLVEAMLRARMRATGGPAPREAADWDAMYRRHGPSELPWQPPAIDEDVARALEAGPAAPASVLDVGTGLGVVAIECARRGYRVVATDLSAVALARAHEAAPDAPVVWVADDITASGLQGRFDIIIDRGCLHLLDDAARDRYAQTLGRLAAPGGIVILKTLDGAAATSRGARAFAAADLEALLGAVFTVERDEPSTMPGPADAPPARLFVLRRGS